MTPIRRIAFLLARVVLAGAIAAFSLSAAQAACAWDINGEWNFYQDNGINARFRINQVGGHLAGDAVYVSDRGGWKGGFQNNVDGRIGNCPDRC